MSAGQRASLEFLLDNLVWLLLVVVLIIFSLTIPNYFQFAIFTNIIEDSTYVGVMAIGLAIVIIAGNMDLSVESTAGLTAMVTGILFCNSGIGLGYTLIWEGVLAGILEGVRFLSVRQATLGVAGALTGEDLGSKPLGLGLSLVEAITLAHGGSVDLASAPGDTTVSVRLPSPAA